MLVVDGILMEMHLDIMDILWQSNSLPRKIALFNRYIIELDW